MKGFRASCFKNDIAGNIDKNRWNWIENDSMFDDRLYKERFVIERTNDWLDAFKAILVQFETNQVHWKALNLLAFISCLIKTSLNNLLKRM